MNTAAKLRTLLARPYGKVTAAQAALMDRGAILRDVREPGEWRAATPPRRGTSPLPSLPTVSVSCLRAARW